MSLLRCYWFLAVSVLWIGTSLSAEPKVSFSRHIKPILAAKCFACHGPDEKERKADLRLDLREAAIQSAIKPRDGAHSELHIRVVTEDVDARMPPTGSKKPAVTAGEAKLIRQWIDEGAEYDAHWAYVLPTRPAVPDVKAKDGLINPIDSFVMANLEAKGIAPSAAADARTLARRLSFDVLGLPASPKDVDDVARDYEAFVDRLLESPHFGERLAQYWLDVVRYADTGGYHSDNHRDVWAYRDYVIKAFNANKPFDQFTVEQLAGDLLPSATDEQRIASGFNRLLQTTEEGGAQPKEYAAKYAADRVRNTSVIWLAATMGCCECHSHKYDPFTHKDFYSFAAFFADVSEKPVGRQDQTKLPTPEQTAELKAIDAKVAALKAEFPANSPELIAAREKWEAETTAKPPKGLAAPVLAALKDEKTKRTAAQEATLDDAFRKQAPELAEFRKRLEPLEKERAALDAAMLSTLVSISVPPRTMRILPRGNWLDDSGEVVQPAVPGFLGSAPPKDRKSLGRMDLARWIVSRENPLTARVFVNRLWKIAFGRGIVRSLEDFGSQGELPTHPELLDWLATDFMDHGWDVKRTFKLLLMSSTYRQASVPTKESLAKDPNNDLFSRQNRFRLDAEFIRDQALVVSHLWNDAIGGPSVKPYQPAGYWSYLNFPKREWENDHGAGQYRRGLYTYWQRTFLHPSLAAFDATSREECTADRPRSNTPQQALVLLNDPTFVEAARAFATRILKDGGQSTTERLRFAFQRALTRSPQANEVDELVKLLDHQQRDYAIDPAAAKLLMSVGDFVPPADLDPIELAAWTSIARVILNLHETITRN